MDDWTFDDSGSTPVVRGGKGCRPASEVEIQFGTDLARLRAENEEWKQLAVDAIEEAAVGDQFIYHDRGVGPYEECDELKALRARFDALLTPHNEEERR